VSPVCPQRQSIPVHWDHNRDASAVIGSIDPATMRERSDGLYVEGSLDIEDSEVAREAWRSVKRNRIGLSFGYLTIDEHEADGVKVLDTLDVFEITLTPSPANADARILSTKGVPDSPDLGLGRVLDQVFATKGVSGGLAPDGVDEQQLREWEQACAADQRKSQPIQVKVFEC
jgi:HK97 family phage prohead protease